MKNRASKTGKSSKQREAYARYIKRADYKPTADERTLRHQSDIADQELIKPKSKNKRRVRPVEIFKLHIKDHWIEWLVVVFIVIASFFVVDSKVNIVKNETNIENHKVDIDEIRMDLKENAKINEAQNLDILRNELKLGNLENQKATHTPAQK